MFTVYINSEDKGSSYYHFEEEFLKICNAHREEDRALMFAFILYDFENPQISKILNDADYWLSLHSISGEYLTVFSLHYKPEDMKKNIQEMIQAKMQGDTSKEMFQIPTIQNPSKDTNKLIRKYFGDDVIIKYPSVLFFQVDKENVINHRFIQLDENSLENSFLELKNYIKVAVQSLDKVSREYKNNYSELFNLVDSSVSGTRKNIQIQKGLRKVTSIAELASTVVGLKL
ncbi:hypothetical protein AV926_02085 [Myroides marinus]|uniref:Uncharacterized protein n=1 Tax=Myroides marinus TaxID=703342 RepID=A0A163V4P2_9FLAO|nr:hypothetical protein [Myroides marinus]KZE74330.1 hypothetical protein AV926_02085 [Myroides marinus]